MNYFLTEQEHAITGLVALPEKDGLRIYVLWDWENQVKQYDIVSGFKSRELCANLTEDTILDACNYGYKMSPQEIKKIFGHLGLVKK